MSFFILSLLDEKNKRFAKPERLRNEATFVNFIVNIL